ncbi:hypothetical protein [Ornithinibacillus massiliensis]|nr:hypothetical protein [Ornithinibacillus massiliensis]
MKSNKNPVEERYGYKNNYLLLPLYVRRSLFSRNPDMINTAVSENLIT